MSAAQRARARQRCSRHGAAGAWSGQVEGENWRAGEEEEEGESGGKSRKERESALTKASVNL